MNAIISFFTFYLSLILALGLGCRIEKKNILNKKIFDISIICMVLLSIAIEVADIPIYYILAFSAYMGIQTMVACMDSKFKEVYSVFLLMGILSLIPLIINDYPVFKEDYRSLLPVMIIALGTWIMSFTFGAADVIYFIVGNVFMYHILNVKIKEDLLSLNLILIVIFSSMLLSIVIFAIKQIKNKNLNKWGNCKEHQAFNPYILYSQIITFSFIFLYF